MLTRTNSLIAAVAALGIAACSSPYSNVYSFKKNSFKAPASKTLDVKAPPTAPDALTGQGVAPGTGIPGDAGIPGVPGAPGAPGEVPGAAPGGGIPGITPPPAPEATPGTPPATPPVTPPVPGA